MSGSGRDGGGSPGAEGPSPGAGGEEAASPAAGVTGRGALAGEALPRRADVVVVGGGIVGLAVAWRLATGEARRQVVVVEKEEGLAAHQTGRNSGVLHSGIYYPPGSLKARTALAGRAAMVRFCAERGIAHEVCGKVIVATGPEEVERLGGLYRRGLDHGLTVERIGPARLRELEPHVAGLAALHVAGTGIVDFRAVCDALAAEVSEAGGPGGPNVVRTGARVVGLDEREAGVAVETTAGDVEAAAVVNCAGLYSDRVARLHAPDDGTRIVPFRGEYRELRPSAAHLVRNLVYPVPDPRFPFLGVHFTRMVHGGVRAGPNAVLALAREGYDWRTVDRHDLAEVARNPAFRTLARRYWRTGAGEVWRSVSRRAFVRALQRLVPEVTVDDLAPAPAGVRAQALSPAGDLLDDFALRESRRVVDVVNAPSPAATASLEIGRLVADLVADRLA